MVQAQHDVVGRELKLTVGCCGTWRSARSLA
jgi:hypothetical protein